MTAKIGLNIHPVYTQANEHTRAYSSEEKHALDTFLLQAQPSTITVLNDFGWAQRFTNMLPNTKVSFRKQHDRDGDYWLLKNADGTPYTPRQHFEGTKEHHDPRIRLHLTNEPLGKTLYDDDGTPDYANIKAMIDWHVECMDLFGASGQPLVVINWGVGLPDLKWFKPDAPEWPLVRPLFEAFKRWTIHTLGIHVYWRKNGFLADDYVNRPRDLAAALSALGYSVQMQVSEYGGDAIDGYPGAWMDTYGDTEEGQKEYARLLVKGQRENLNLPCIEGIDTYSWGCYPRWTKYDISKARHIQDAIILSNLNLPAEAPPTPTPLEPPIPIHWITTIANVTGGEYVRLRLRPDVNSAELARVKNGDVIEYEGEATRGWWHIRLNGIEGYCHDDFFEPGIKELPAPLPPDTPPQPIPPPAPTQTETDLRRVAQCLADIDRKATTVEQLHAEIKALEAEIRALTQKYLPAA